MNENSHPYDPYRDETGNPGPAEQTGADTAASDSAPANPGPDHAANAAEQHPHDPFAREAARDQAAPSDAYAAPSDPYAAPATGAAGATGSGYDQQNPGDGQQSAGYNQQNPGYDQQGGYGQPQGNAYAGQGTAEGTQTLHAAPPTVKGVYEGQLSGQPTSDSDSRLWSMFSHLAVVLGHLMSWGFLGWIGPLIIFLMYKDRDRFIRYNAAEALNGAIAVVIAQVVLSVLLGIIGVVTLGFGFVAFPLVGIPALIQLIFAIIGAVKANQGEWWNYPLNIRLVK